MLRPLGTLHLKGYYNLGLIAAEYEALPGIIDADPHHDLSDGETIHYVFDDRWGDCLDGCFYGEARYYTSSAAGEVTFVDHFEWSLDQQIIWPDWFDAYNACEYQY